MNRSSVAMSNDLSMWVETLREPINFEESDIIADSSLTGGIDIEKDKGTAFLNRSSRSLLFTPIKGKNRDQSMKKPIVNKYKPSQEILAETLKCVEHWLPIVANEKKNQELLKTEILNSKKKLKKAPEVKSYREFVERLITEIISLSNENNYLKIELKKFNQLISKNKEIPYTNTKSYPANAVNKEQMSIIKNLQHRVNELSNKDSYNQVKISNLEKRLAQLNQLNKRNNQRVILSQKKTHVTLKEQLILQNKLSKSQSLLNQKFIENSEIALASKTSSHDCKRLQDEITELKSRLEATDARLEAELTTSAEAICNLQVELQQTRLKLNNALTAASSSSGKNKAPKSVSGSVSGSVLVNENAKLKLQLQQAAASKGSLSALEAKNAELLTVNRKLKAELASGKEMRTRTNVAQRRHSASDSTVASLQKEVTSLRERLKQAARRAVTPQRTSTSANTSAISSQLSSLREELRVAKLATKSAEDALAAVVSVMQGNESFLGDSDIKPLEEVKAVKPKRQRVAAIYNEPVAVQPRTSDTSALDNDDSLADTTAQRDARLTRQVKNALIESLRRHFLFRNSSESELEEIVMVMTHSAVAKGEEVCVQAEPGQHFYVVMDGSLDVIVNGELVGEVEAGDCFGELALLHGTPRAATIRAAGDCELWLLDRVDFRTALAAASTTESESRLEALRSIPLLEELDGHALEQLVTMMRTLTYEAGNVIFKQGDSTDCMYIVSSGDLILTNVSDEVHHHNSDQEEAVLTSGDYFGYEALATNSVGRRNCTVTTTTPCTLFALDRHSFNDLLGSECILRNKKLKMVQNTAEFKHHPLPVQKAIANCLQLVSFKPCHLFDIECRKLYYLHQGEVISTNKPLDSGAVAGLELDMNTDGLLDLLQDYQWLSLGDHFGSLDGKAAASSSSSLSLIAVDNVECFVLEHGTYESLLSSESNKRGQLTEHDDSSFDIFRYEVLRESYYQGAFGPFHYVKRKGDLDDEGTVLTLQVLEKKRMEESNSYSTQLNSRSILKQIRYPFIVKLLETGQDEQHLYNLVQYLPGVDLFARLEAVLVLEEIHQYDFIYRGLKPESLMFDCEGYLMVGDFSFAKQMSSRYEKTFTLCGSPNYLAPEAILGRGYTMTADFWCLGVLLYDMVVGEPPWGNDDNTLDVCRHILQSQVKFPVRADKETKSLIRSLLVKNPVKRLGNADVNDIKNHAAFRNIDFAQLLERKIRPPWKPTEFNVVLDEQQDNSDTPILLY